MIAVGQTPAPSWSFFTLRGCVSLPQGVNSSRALQGGEKVGILAEASDSSSASPSQE